MGNSVFARWVQATCLVAGALGAVLVEIVTPLGDGKTATLAARAAAHPGAMRLVLVGDGLGLLLVPGVLVVAGLARPQAARLAAVAGTIAFAGYLCLIGVIARDVLVYEASGEADRASAVSLVNAFQSNGLEQVLLGVYIAGTLIGLVLLGLALWRSGTIPRWAAAFVIVEPAFEILDHGAGVGSRAGAVGYGLVMVAFAYCAARVLGPARSGNGSPRPS